MSRIISRAEIWKELFKKSQFINYSSMDYDSIKSALIDHIKQTFPEEFNDYIESSEVIILIEAFSYVGALMNYRLDLNAHENFLSTAQRKDSILRLAKLISYKPTRNTVASGLVKITSISTTERVFDVNGVELTNRVIRWNDPNNSNWKNQFLTVMNRVLQRDFGSVLANERKQIGNVLYELYSLNNNFIQNGVLTYNTTFSNENLLMELTSSSFSDDSIIEKRPEIDTPFSILYGNDGLGDNSDNTGFFFLTKQGSLQRFDYTLDGITPNQKIDVPAVNVNNTDVWVNNVDSTTLEIINNDITSDVRSGEWYEVDTVFGQNIFFNTVENRNKFELETLDEDKIRIIFGDGDFANIPSGLFNVWLRSSVNRDVFIPKNAIVNKSSLFQYMDNNGNVQTFNFTFSSISSMQSVASEDIEHIRNNAPSVYFTQDRMVSGRDYNSFMLQDPSILKLRAVNRTWAGDSKHLTWFDPSDSYNDVKLFGSDLALYYQTTEDQLNISSGVSSTVVFNNYLEPLLSTADVILTEQSLGVLTPSKVFTNNEKNAILSPTALNAPSVNFDLYYRPLQPNDKWNVGFISDGTKIFNVAGNVISGWVITIYAKRLIAESRSISFWNTNDSQSVITYDSLQNKYDNVIVLSANINGNKNGVLENNIQFDVVGHDIDFDGTANVHKLHIVPSDVNSDNIPDIEQIETLLNKDVDLPVATNIDTNLLDNTLITLDFSYIHSIDDLQVFYDGEQKTVGVDWDYVGSATNSSNQIIILDEDAFESIENIGSITSNTFFVPGDVSEDLYVGKQFWVENSTGLPSNNTTAASPYTVVSVFYNNTTFNTEITVSSIPNSSPTTFGDIKYRKNKFQLKMMDYVYFNRVDVLSEYVPIDSTLENKLAYYYDSLVVSSNDLYKRELGRYLLNFSWNHYTPNFHLINPSFTNIIDIFVVTNSYHQQISEWLSDQTDTRPIEPTSLQLRTIYSKLLNNKMISDTVILHSGKIKPIFGSKAIPELQAKFKIIKSSNSSLTDNQIKVKVVDIVRDFFDISKWEFGETFYFTELSTVIHQNLISDINSIVLVPSFTKNQFGDLFQIFCREDEILQPNITISDVEIVDSYNLTNLRQ